jgi:hypothetical protein
VHEIVGRLQCQINMKLVFRISEDGSEILFIFSTLKVYNSEKRTKSFLTSTIWGFFAADFN